MGLQKGRKPRFFVRFVVWKQVRVAPSNKTSKKSNKSATKGLRHVSAHLVWASGLPWGALKVFDYDNNTWLYGSIAPWSIALLIYCSIAPCCFDTG